MSMPHPRGAIRRAASTLLVVMAACSGGGPTPPTDCPPCPPLQNAALRLTVEFDAAAHGLVPAGFKVQDLTRIDLVVQSAASQPQTFSLTPPQNAAFVDVIAGSYTISATGYSTDLIMFTANGQVTVTPGDTANVQLAMQAALGAVEFLIDDKTTGTVDAVAGEEVPFIIRVRNLQGRLVPNAAVVLRSSGNFGAILVSGSDATDLQGEVRGTIRAPVSGAMSGFSLTVDGRSITIPTGLRVQFATAVDAGLSDITALTSSFVTADGVDTAEFAVLIRNASGAPLPEVPVIPTSSRNVGVETNVDRFQPASGYESGKTDNFGIFRFRLTSTTSSFMQLDAQGRLYSAPDAGRVFHPATIRITADGVQIDQREVTFNSTVNPNGGGLVAAPQFVIADGQSSALIIVNIQELAVFGGGPAAGVFIELINSLNVSLNYTIDVRPEPGFTGFRTNAQGEWRGRLRSATPAELFLFAKGDGRALILNPRSVFFR